MNDNVKDDIFQPQMLIGWGTGSGYVDGSGRIHVNKINVNDPDMVAVFAKLAEKLKADRTPQIKRRVAIGRTENIYFWADEKTVDLLKPYGHVTKLWADGNKYQMHLDPRYDTADVIAYLQSLK